MQEDIFMDALEQKEIRGLNFKTLLTVLISTVCIVSSVVGTYFATSNKIDNLYLLRASDEKVNALTIQSLRAELESVKVQLKSTQDEVRSYHSLK